MLSTKCTYIYIYIYIYIYDLALNSLTKTKRSIWPMGPLWVSVNLGVMPMNGYFILSRIPECSLTRYPVCLWKRNGCLNVASTWYSHCIKEDKGWVNSWDTSIKRNADWTRTIFAPAWDAFFLGDPSVNPTLCYILPLQGVSKSHDAIISTAKYFCLLVTVLPCD